MELKPVFAIDVGGVLANQQHDGPVDPLCLAVLHQLSHKYELHIVSQCGNQRKKDTMYWLAQREVPIDVHRQHYVTFKQSKAPVLAQLKAVWFIDDRVKHLEPAANLGISVIHWRPEPFTAVFRHPKCHVAFHWSHVRDLLL